VNKNIVIIFTGFLIILGSLLVDVIGLGDKQGFHFAQLAGVLAGFTVLCYGVYQNFLRGRPFEKRLYAFLGKIFTFKNIGLVFTILGILVTVVALTADYLGIGDNTGINKSQLKGVLLGLTCAALGLWLWRPDQVASERRFYKIIRFLLAGKTIGILLLLVGSLIIIWMVGVEVLVEGAHPGFGIVQLIGVILGALCVVIGLWKSFLHQFIHIEKLNPVIKFPAIRRMYIALLILGLGITGIYLTNNIYSRIDMEKESFVCINYFDEAANHVGADFRTGIYRPPKAELHRENIYLTGLSNYPPFTILFFTPLQLFDEDTAYIIIVALLTLANIGALLMSTLLVGDILLTRLNLESSNVVTIATALFIAILFYTISGYPFMFSIERGNYDSIAIFFAILGIYLMVKKPETLWWQVICISIAAHLKMYPAALFIVLLYKHGRKMIIPAIFVNVVMLLSLGYKNAIWFIEIMIDYTLAPQVWVGNHSGFSFAGYMLERIPDLAIYSTELKNFFTLLPIIIWVFSCYYCVRLLKPDISILMLTMASIPLMCTLPTVSHDYKLLVLHPAILVFISLLVYKIIRDSRLWDYLQLVLVIALSLFISRSFKIIADPYWYISNKYLLILVLSILMLVNIYYLKKDPAFARSAVEAQPT